METLWQWGLDLIITIQQIHGPFLDSVFRVITSMGDESFFLIFLPLVIWCVDYKLGARLAVLLLLASYFNIVLKDIFQQPRPFMLVPEVKLADAGGYGLPSGHSQSVVVVWGYLAARVKKAWFWVVAVGLMLLVGFSRVYLGVHFPTDVIAGWVVGVGLLVLYLAVRPKVEGWLGRLSLTGQLLLAFFVPLVLLLWHPVEDNTMVLATLSGLGVGLVLTNRYVSFNARGSLRQLIARFLVGGVVALLLYAGLKVVFPGVGESFYLVFRFLRYGLVGLWVSLGAPWLFKKVRLATES